MFSSNISKTKKGSFHFRLPTSRRELLCSSSATFEQQLFEFNEEVNKRWVYLNASQSENIAVVDMCSVTSLTNQL